MAVEGSRYGSPQIILCLPITRDYISPWGREKWHGREDKSFFIMEKSCVVLAKPPSRVAMVDQAKLQSPEHDSIKLVDDQMNW